MATAATDPAVRSAEILAARLNSNVNALYLGRIGYDEFTRRQRATWDEVDATGATHNVLALLRGDHDDLIAAEVLA